MSKRSPRKWGYSAWRWARRTWWRLLETWPFSPVVMFVKSLPLLALWLFTAWGIFRRLPPSLKTPDKEALSLLGALVTAAIGFGAHQWKILTEEERSRQQKCQGAMEEIDKLEPLIRSDPSAGARRYVDMIRRGGVWKSGRVCSRLEEVWSTAPVVLQDAVELLNDLESVRRLGAERSAKALEWAMTHLDDEWQQKARERLQLLGQQTEYKQHVSGQVLREVEQRAWRAILRPWPRIAFWRGFPPSAGHEIAKGLDYLGLKGNPFGSAEAETDTLLLHRAIDPPWLKALHTPQPIIVIGAPGSGKTATAFLLARDGLRARDAFPVYFPATPGDLELARVAQAMARTLLHYLASMPTDFLECRVAGKAAMAHLLARYTGPNLVLCLHQAGLPLTGDGARMLREIETVQGGVCQETLSDEELLILLGEARPYGFRYTMLLLDVQEQMGENTGLDAILQPLPRLTKGLARVGVFTKAFVRGRSSPDRMVLQWSDDDLSGLLDARLAWVGVDAVATWCDPREGVLSPDARLICAAHGLPGNLIRKGNALLRRIGQTQHLLTARDLEELLGPMTP